MSSDDEDLPLVNALRLADAARVTAAGARALLSDDASDDEGVGDGKNDDANIGDAATAAPPGLSSPAKAAAAAAANGGGSMKTTPVKPPKSVSPVPDWIKSATPSKVKRFLERNPAIEAIDRSSTFSDTAALPSLSLLETKKQPSKPATSSDDSSDGKPLALKANALRAALGMDGGGEGEEDGGGDEAGEHSSGAATAAPASAAVAALPPKAPARGAAAKEAAAAAKAAAGEAEAAGTTGEAAPAAANGGAAATAGDAAATAMVASASARNHSTGIPLFVPDRLPASRFLVELEDAVEGGRMDLAGDAGVVGRLLVAGPQPKKKGNNGASGGGESEQQAPRATEPEVRFDLKGRLYRATIVPSSSTLAVVNVQQDAARVEAVSRCFIKLDPETAPGDDGDDGWGGEAGDRGGTGVGGFEFDDDEDPWAMAVPSAAAAAGKGGEGEDGGAAGAGGGKKRKKKAASSSQYGGGGGKPRAKAKPKKKRK